MSKRKRIQFKAKTGDGRLSIAAVDAAKKLDDELPELTQPSFAFLDAPGLIEDKAAWRKMRVGAWVEVCDCVRAAGYRVTACYALSVETFAGALVLNRVTGGAKGTTELVKFFQLFCMSPSGRARKLDEDNPAKEAETQPLAPLGMGAIMAAIKGANK